MRPFLISIAALLCTTAHGIAGAQAQSQSQANAPEVMEKLVVSGEQPGPGLWRISKGDGVGDSVLWIMGTQTPSPIKMTWRAKGIDAVIAQANEILAAPSADVSIRKLGFFTTLTLLPSAIEVKKNPGGAMLKDVLPPDVYARWLVARDKYISGYNTEDNDIETWRPMFAAAELYSSGLKRAGMSSASVVWPVIRDLAKKHNVKISEVRYEPVLKDPRAAVRELNKTRLADVDCLIKTMERIDSEIEAMRAHANAWAVGNIDIIRKRPISDQRVACESAILNSTAMKAIGQQDMLAQIENTWMSAAEKALTNNKVTLAVLPMARLVAADGYLAKLKAKGYVIREPDAEE